MLFLTPVLPIKKLAASSSGTQFKLLTGVKAEHHIAAVETGYPANEVKGGEISLYGPHSAPRPNCISDRYEKGMVRYAAVVKRLRD
jgi:hypothetical protein